MGVSQFLDDSAGDNVKSSVFFDMIMREITTKGDGRKQRIQATRWRKAWNNLIERHVVTKIDQPIMSRIITGGVSASRVNGLGSNYQCVTKGGGWIQHIAIWGKGMHHNPCP